MSNSGAKVQVWKQEPYYFFPYTPVSRLVLFVSTAFMDSLKYFEPKEGATS